MALAQKGALGDRLFRYDQKGPQSLLASWDRTYYMSCLLSDIHYMIGDISLSEGYAMEGLTLAKRGGSPRLLQRLVKISLIRGDFALAGCMGIFRLFLSAGKGNGEVQDIPVPCR